MAKPDWELIESFINKCAATKDLEEGEKHAQSGILFRFLKFIRKENANDKEEGKTPE